MVYATVWHLEDNPIATPFYLVRDLSEDDILRFNGDEDSAAFEQFIHSLLYQAARFYVDEVKEGASFHFISSNNPISRISKDLQATFELESPSGPITCEYYQDRLSFKLSEWAMVKVKEAL